MILPSLSPAGCGERPAARQQPLRQPAPAAKGEVVAKQKPAPRTRAATTLENEPGPFRFTDITPGSGVDFVHVSGMTAEKLFPTANGSGVAVFDYDGDGKLDLYFATGNALPLSESPAASNRLYKNLGGGRFRDETERSGLGFRGYCHGVTIGDIDNDGDLDVFLSNYGGDALFVNNGNGTFTDVSHAAGVDAAMNGRTVAVADYDNDGWPDMFVANYGQPPILYHNDSGLGYVDLNNHWLTVDLVGTRSNRDGVGAEIALWAHGLPMQLRQIQEGTSLGAGNAKDAHFGLGHAAEADRIVVRWPSGAVQTLRHVPGDRRIVIVEPGRSRWPRR
jgi:hypothetical protein